MTCQSGLQVPFRSSRGVPVRSLTGPAPVTCPYGVTTASSARSSRSNFRAMVPFTRADASLASSVRPIATELARSRTCTPAAKSHPDLLCRPCTLPVSDPASRAGSMPASSPSAGTSPARLTSSHAASRVFGPPANLRRCDGQRPGPGSGGSSVCDDRQLISG